MAETKKYMSSELVLLLFKGHTQRLNDIRGFAKSTVGLRPINIRVVVIL